MTSSIDVELIKNEAVAAAWQYIEPCFDAMKTLSQSAKGKPPSPDVAIMVQWNPGEHLALKTLAGKSDLMKEKLAEAVVSAMQAHGTSSVPEETVQTLVAQIVNNLRDQAKSGNQADQAQGRESSAHGHDTPAVSAASTAPIEPYGVVEQASEQPGRAQPIGRFSASSKVDLDVLKAEAVAVAWPSVEPYLSVLKTLYQRDQLEKRENPARMDETIIRQVSPEERQAMDSLVKFNKVMREELAEALTARLHARGVTSSVDTVKQMVQDVVVDLDRRAKDGRHTQETAVKPVTARDKGHYRGR